MCNSNSGCAAEREAHYRAPALWMNEHPGRSFCGQADPEAYCGKPFVRGRDYYDHQYTLRLVVM